MTRPAELIEENHRPGTRARSCLGGLKCFGPEQFRQAQSQQSKTTHLERAPARKARRVKSRAGKRVLLRIHGGFSVVSYSRASDAQNLNQTKLKSTAPNDPAKATAATAQVHSRKTKSFELSRAHKMSSSSGRRSLAASSAGRRLFNSDCVGARVSAVQKSSSTIFLLGLSEATRRRMRFSFSARSSLTVGPLIIWKAWAMLHSHERSVSVVNSRGGLPNSSRNWSNGCARRFPLLSGRTPGNCAARIPVG